MTMATLNAIACHEAGHAVMRVLRGYPATELTATEDRGFCAGTGRLIRVEDEILINLAGFAVEYGYGLCDIDLSIPIPALTSTRCGHCLLNSRNGPASD
jgi:hypothetical protein